jgi:hypothetical protein
MWRPASIMRWAAAPASGKTWSITTFISLHFGELNRGVTDSAGAAVDEYRPAGPEPATVNQIGPDGEEVFRQGGRLREIEPARDRQAVAGVSHAIFRVAGSGRQRADLVAEVPPGDCVAACRNTAGDLQSENG